MSDPAQNLPTRGDGAPESATRLPPEIYNELRRLSAARLAHEKPGQTMETTALGLSDSPHSRRRLLS